MDLNGTGVLECLTGRHHTNLVIKLLALLSMLAGCLQEREVEVPMARDGDTWAVRVPGDLLPHGAMYQASGDHGSTLQPGSW
jgi:hypothetical protein